MSSKIEYKNIHEMEERKSRWVAETKALKNFDGIKNTLTKLYTSAGHFIYELLQNAEDAQAHKVEFVLFDDKLIFTHDGEKLFSLKDIDAITNIGDSTKVDDGNNIGKFGIGFKSVFEYTDNPEILSGEFNFRIEDMFVPKELEQKEFSKTTVITLPFNKIDKNSEKCFEEIVSAFNNMKIDILLFLKNIGQITCLWENRKIEFLREEESENNMPYRSCNVVRIVNQKKKIKSYMRYFKKVEVIDKDEKKEIEVAIAFNIITQKEKWCINPLLSDGAPSGKVYTFFPCEQEKSNLCFHIHAPFALTVSREALRDEPANNEIIKHLSSLVCEAVDDLKQQNMLDMSLLKTLPNKDDMLGKYNVFRERVKNLFLEESYTPMRNGGFAAAEGKMRGTHRLFSTFSDEDLSEIFATPTNDLWVQNPNQQNQRDDKFLQTLNIKKFDISEFVGFLYELMSSNASRYDSLIDYFQKNTKPISFYVNLYAEFYKEADLDKIRYLKLCLCRDRKLYRFCDCYLAEDSSNIMDDAGHIVHGEILNDQQGGKHDISETVVSFLKYKIGMKYYTLITYVSEKCEKIENLADGEEKIKSIFELQKIYNTCDVYKKYEVIGEIKRHKIFKSSDGFYQKITELYLPASYGLKRTKHLKIYYDVYNAMEKSNPKKYRKRIIKPISDDYLSQLSDAGKKSKFVDFLTALGILISVTIERTSIWDNDNHSVIWRNAEGGRDGNETSIDYKIPYIEFLLKQPSLEILKLLWSFLINTDCETYSICSYRRAQKYDIKHYPSQVVNDLKKHKWVAQLDKDDKIYFETPANSLKERLPRNMQVQLGLFTQAYVNLYTWIKTLGFFENSIKQSEERKKAEESFTSQGFSKNMLDNLRKAKNEGISNEELERALEQLINEHISSRQLENEHSDFHYNESRIQQKISERFEEADAIEYEKRMRSIRTTSSETKNLAKKKLADFYTSRDNSAMICQLCKKPMPFKDKTGKFYFEAVQIFDSDVMKKETDNNYLALCPVCAAKYKVWCDKNTKQFLFNNIRNLGHSNINFKIKLDKEYMLYFEKRHILALSAEVNKLK